jgi:hypothetical protein
MNVKMCWSILAVLACSTWSVFAQERDDAAPPPPPGDEAAERAEDRLPPPADDGSPSDRRPDLNDRRTTRNYAGQAPGKQAPMQQGPFQAPGKEAPMAQAPGKQAPMQQGPMQAPGKGALYGGQTHTTGYANYNCAGCGDGGYQQNYYSGGYNTGNRYARRGLFGRRWR